MPPITIHSFEVKLETFFKQPILFRDAALDDMAQGFLRAFAKYGLKHSNISLNRGDEVYQFDMSIVLFGSNGDLTISADKVTIELRNAMSRNDLEIVMSCLETTQASVSKWTGERRTNIHATAQVKATPGELPNGGFLRQFARPERGIPTGGTVALFETELWPDKIKLLAEPSFLHEGGIFLSWFAVADGELTLARLETLVSAFEKAAEAIDLQIQPLL